MSSSANIKGDAPDEAPHPQRNLTASFKDLRTDDGSFSFLGGSSSLEQHRIQLHIEDHLLSSLRSDTLQNSSFELQHLLPFIARGMEVIVQDDFSKCFQSSNKQAWNWNLYLMPLWSIGVVVRYCILFPIRLLCLIFGMLLTILLLCIVKLVLPGRSVSRFALRSSLERKLIRFLCSTFVFSWTGVIKYHGNIPANKKNRIYVANHTSLIDMIILSQMNTFSLVGQKQGGWLGFMQGYVLGSLNNVFFNRGEQDDRDKAQAKIKEHINTEGANRLLVFPEGTCVNNEYICQFKQGAFAMDAEVCPIAIKYNKIFVDAFWNSRAQSFAMNLVTLMCSWAVVCDVWYLEPCTRMNNETPIAFSNRVKKIIADRAGLKNVDFDGYLKHFRPSARYQQQQQQLFSQSLMKRLTAAERAEIELQERQMKDAQQRAQNDETDAESAPDSVNKLKKRTFNNMPTVNSSASLIDLLSQQDEKQQSTKH